MYLFVKLILTFRNFNLTKKNIPSIVPAINGAHIEKRTFKMQNKDKKTTVKNQPTKNVQKSNESYMKILGYTYGVILRVFDKTLTEKDAFEMIRAAFQLGKKN